MQPSSSLRNVKEMFNINVEVLAALVDPKNPDALQEMGGIKGIAESLHVDLRRGLSDTYDEAIEIETQRIEKYPNRLSNITLLIPYTTTFSTPSIIPFYYLVISSFNQFIPSTILHLIFSTFLFNIISQPSPLLISSPPWLMRSCARTSQKGMTRTRYGRNILPKRELESFWSMLFDAAKDKVMIMLVCAAIVSIILGVLPYTSEDPV